MKLLANLMTRRSFRTPTSSFLFWNYLKCSWTPVSLSLLCPQTSLTKALLQLQSILFFWNFTPATPTTSSFVQVLFNGPRWNQQCMLKLALQLWVYSHFRMSRYKHSTETNHQGISIEVKVYNIYISLPC